MTVESGKYWRGRILTNPDCGFPRDGGTGVVAHDPDRRQFHDPGFLNLQPFFPEVSLGIERPMEAAHYPVRQTLDVNLNLGVDLGTPRRYASPVLGEAVD